MSATVCAADEMELEKGAEMEQRTWVRVSPTPKEKLAVLPDPKLMLHLLHA